MKISETWLREWVSPAITTDILASQLTMAGLEVDSVAPVAGPFNHVCVAKVIETTRHPQADKLTLCLVDCGAEEPLRIVCGASNVRAGLTVALARIGAELPGGFSIKEAKLRGELSQGMLCSATELGMQDQTDGIMELPDDAPLGMDLRAYLNLDDHVFDISLTPNRADCFSILGIAREVAGFNELPLTLKPVPQSHPDHDKTRAIRLNANEACSSYVGCRIQGINPNAITPLWMSERLRRAGLRTIHPIVDITNYVMLELGQPMHAFDDNKIKGDIQIRFSTPGETLVLLDGQLVTLKDKTLMIADQHQALAMAGIMGGQDSAVSETTENVFLESAFFNPAHIAGVARQYGLCTDSSQRFERGVDPTLQSKAMARAIELIRTITGGQVGPMVIEGTTPKPHTLSFNPNRVEQLTGVTVSEERMQTMLQALGMTVQSATLPWEVTVPTHRFDLRLDVDLVEEIIRLYGYDKISTDSMSDTLRVGTIYANETISRRIGNFLCHRGYHEIISYSFVDPAIQQEMTPTEETLRLLNPISSELSEMRVSLWPGLLAALVYNSHRQQALIKLFETGVLFERQGSTHQEHPHLAGLITGEHGGLNWSEPKRALDFFDLKGDLEALFAKLSLHKAQFIPAEHTALHPGKCARIHLNGNPIGWIGALHPRLVDAFDLDTDVLLFDLALADFSDQPVPRYQPISKYPSVRRDLSFLIDQTIQAAQIERVVRETVDAKRLKSFDVFDVYDGESIPLGKKSIAIALTLQDDDRTLVDDDVNSMVETIIAKLNQDFAITLRD